MDIERHVHQLATKLAAGITRVLLAEIARRKSCVSVAACAAREQEIARQLADLEEKPADAASREADERPVSDVQGGGREAVPVDEPAAERAAPVAPEADRDGEAAATDETELEKRPRRRSHVRPRELEQMPVLTRSERAVPIDDDDEDDDEEDLPPAKRDRFDAIQASAAKRTGVLPKPRTTVTF